MRDTVSSAARRACGLRLRRKIRALGLPLSSIVPPGSRHVYDFSLCVAGAAKALARPLRRTPDVSIFDRREQLGQGHRAADITAGRPIVDDERLGDLLEPSRRHGEAYDPRHGQPLGRRPDRIDVDLLRRIPRGDARVVELGGLIEVKIIVDDARLNAKLSFIPPPLVG